MYQRFAPLGILGNLFFEFSFKQSIEILVFISKLSVRFAKTNGNYQLFSSLCDAQ
jgi:hypothetical protein